jgi:hypothetical protein
MYYKYYLYDSPLPEVLRHGDSSDSLTGVIGLFAELPP